MFFIDVYPRQLEGNLFIVGNYFLQYFNRSGLQSITAESYAVVNSLPKHFLQCSNRWELRGICFFRSLFSINFYCSAELRRRRYSIVEKKPTGKSNYLVEPALPVRRFALAGSRQAGFNRGFIVWHNCSKNCSSPWENANALATAVACAAGLPSPLRLPKRSGGQEGEGSGMGSLGFGKQYNHLNNYCGFTFWFYVRENNYFSHLNSVSQSGASKLIILLL